MQTTEKRYNKNKPLPAGFIWQPVHFLALGFGSGCVPRMPGTAGTLVGILCYLLIADLGLMQYLILVAVMFVAGIALCQKTAADLGVHDHGAIVWDEVVGYLITMTAVPQGWPWVMAGFILFRLFDIWKPWPINWMDRKLTGGFGIMLDDVLAGVYALVLLQLSAYLL